MNVLNLLFNFFKINLNGLIEMCKHPNMFLRCVKDNKVSMNIKIS